MSQQLDLESRLDEAQGSSLYEEQLNTLENSSKPASTQKSSAYGIKTFKEWMLKRAKNCDFATVTAGELNDLLRKLYAEVKSTKQSVSLSPSTMTCLRAPSMLICKNN